MRIILVCIALSLVGCATEQKLSWATSGGSRADATVELAYNYNEATTKPLVDPSEARELALKRCGAWGFTDAEAFGVSKRDCQQFGTGIYQQVCIDRWVTLEFQCLGTGDTDND